MSALPIVSIQGNGIVAMSLALHLARLPLQVHWVRSPAFLAPSSKDVRVYAINAVGKHVLQAIDCWPSSLPPSFAEKTPPSTAIKGPPSPTPSKEVLTSVSRIEVRGDTKGRLQWSSPLADAPPLAWIIDVPWLENRLQQQLDQHPQIQQRTTVDQASQLTVICEGKMSAQREAHGLHMQRYAYPHHAIATQVQAERPHQSTAYQWFDGEHILGLLPLHGADSAQMGVVWSAPANKVQSCMQMPEPDRTQYLNQMLTGISQGHLGALTINTAIQSWPLFLGKVTHWVKPGLALAGDAAHAVHPLAGHGLNLGLEDVDCLTRLLQNKRSSQSVGDWGLLRRYQRLRAWDTFSMQTATDHLFYLFNASPSLRGLSFIRNQGMHILQSAPCLMQSLLKQASSASSSPSSLIFKDFSL